MADSRHAMVTNINAQDKDGNTELHRVVGSGSPNSVEKLLKANPGLNSNIQNIAGDTPLHIAVSGGSPNLVEKLFEQMSQELAQSYQGEDEKSVAKDITEALTHIHKGK